MLPSPGSSPTTTAARQRRGAERFAAARKRVLDRNGLTEADVINLAEGDAARSTLGSQILFELVHCDWAKQQLKIEDELRKLEDASDVADRRVMVLAENAKKEFPYPPTKIRSLLGNRRKDIEQYSNNLYWTDMFRGSPQETKAWQPSVDVQSVIAGMTAEAIHKQAFYMVGESERLTKIRRRQRQARFLLDFLKVSVGFLILGVVSWAVATIGAALGLEFPRVFAATLVCMVVAHSVATYETPTGVTRKARLWQLGFVILLWLIFVLHPGGDPDE